MFAEQEIARGNIEPTMKMRIFYRGSEFVVINSAETISPMENLKSVSIVIKDD
jgi:hypothetical protein